MALPTAPNLAASNPFAGLPSYSGSDSSVNTGASNVIAGSTPNYTTNNPAFAQAFLSASTTGPAINPFATLVSDVSTKISASQIAAQASLPNIGDLSSKVDLNATIGRLSGELGSPLNGMTGDLMAAAQQATGTLSTDLLGGLTTLAGSTSNITADIAGSLNKLTGGNLVSGIQSAAGAISGAAGQLSNLLSLRRGVNLPAGGEVFSSTGQEITLLAESDADWRVRITCNWEMFNSPLFKVLERTGGVVWPYLPTVQLSTKATYTQIDTTHNNYPFQAYKNSHVDDIEISGEFSCETSSDAEYWIAATTFFKTATKMFFGQGDNVGHPPIICYLRGYGSSVFDNIPVVVKSFSVQFPEDANYINYAPTNTWVPVMSSISVTVSPIYNRERLRKFSLQDYASGGLVSKQSGGNVGYI